jgi:hypothetical protein
MKQWQLTPSHSPAAARKRWEDSRQFLTKADYDLLVEESGVGVVDGETKFLFLRNAFGFATEFYGALSQLRFKPSKRASCGGDLLMGYFFDPRNKLRLTNDTLAHQEFYNIHLSALLSWTGRRVRRQLRPYWNEQRSKARGNGQYVVPSAPARPRPGFREDKDYKLWIHSERQFLANFPLGTIFSTIQINRSAPFLPHQDAKNEGGLVCLMAFGEFTGGDFCLPRLRVAFRLRPGDLLIADNNNEYHGNVGGIYGDRISLVAFLRSVPATVSTSHFNV